MIGNMNIDTSLSIGNADGGTNSQLILYSGGAGDNMTIGHISGSIFSFHLEDETETINFKAGIVDILDLTETESTFHGDVSAPNYTISGTPSNTSHVIIKIMLIKF